MMKSIKTRDGKREFIRFGPLERTEHIVQVISFSVLVLTGLSQRFNQNAASELMIHYLGGIEMVRLIHRTFGVILILESLFHVVSVSIRLATGRTKISSMMFYWKDVRDAVHMVLYFVGIRKERARFDRYDFRHKSEYWSLVWGTVVMIITGLMMWFPVQVTNYLPGELIPAAKEAHGGEGMLAFLAIIVWHMYGAHLQADVFPFDKTIFTGKISEERMIHEHPLEYERIIAAEREAGAKPAEKG